MSPKRAPKRGAEALSSRQREALRLLVADIPPKVIARELGISYRMVHRHLEAACRIYGVVSVAAAAYRFGKDDEAA